MLTDSSSRLRDALTVHGDQRSQLRAAPILFAMFTLVGVVTFLSLGSSAFARPPEKPMGIEGQPAHTQSSQATREAELERPGPGNASMLELEVLAATTQKQLGQLAAAVAGPRAAWSSKLNPLATPEFECAALRPLELREVFRDQKLAVYRERPQAATTPSGPSPRGPAALIEELDQLTRPYSPAEQVRVAFKTFRVSNEGGSLITRAYFHAVGTTARHLIEQTAVWQMQWYVPAANQPPQLSHIEVEEFEESMTIGDNRPLFADQTVSVFGHDEAFREQLVHGVEYWRRRLQARTPLDYRAHYGAAIGDVNGDGLEDIYLCQPNGLPNRLFIHQPDHTVRDASAESGVDWLDASRSALLLDLDNDGDQDLVLSMYDAVLIMSNDGLGNFSTESTLAGPRRPFSMAAADYDQDGDVDIYVCAFWRLNVYDIDPVRAIAAVPTPWHDANNGEPNYLYRNDGQFSFTDVTDRCGLSENNTRFSHAAAWEDFDNDGDVDLYVANDFGRNNLYRNEQGMFVDIAAEAGVEDQAAGMSVSWADYNHDGWMDLYVSNMFSSAGNRITYHRDFQHRLSDQARAEFRRHARGNTLFENAVGQCFKDSSEPAGVILGRWAWGSRFIDINNDGWEDLFVANGFLTNEDTRDL